MLYQINIDITKHTQLCSKIYFQLSYQIYQKIIVCKQVPVCKTRAILRRRQILLQFRK